MPIPQTPFAAAAATAALLFFFLHAATADPVHDMLPEYGLPIGLVPDSVTAYSLSESGDFEIELANPCYVQFSDLVYYEKKITGKVSYGAISDLSGIQAKKLFFWVSVTGIEVVGSDQIKFEVGIISETLPAGQFEKIPTCKAKASWADLLIGTSLAEV